ncbi:hypothetical protein C8R44DRAFT_880973 [Mycena epipterygia]|nr:hypothetical protein C8R44DRAFT_880973 [Mycena epipterygia]
MDNCDAAVSAITHTCNPVPFILAGARWREDEEEGALCDVASTVRDLLGLPKPEGVFLLCLFFVAVCFADDGALVALEDGREEIVRQEAYIK